MKLSTINSTTIKPITLHNFKLQIIFISPSYKILCFELFLSLQHANKTFTQQMVRKYEKLSAAIHHLNKEKRKSICRYCCSRQIYNIAGILYFNSCSLGIGIVQIYETGDVVHICYTKRVEFAFSVFIKLSLTLLISCSFVSLYQTTKFLTVVSF